MTFETAQQRTYATTVDAAARAAWEGGHPGNPWASCPESVRDAMRGLVRPTVDTVLEHLRDTLYPPHTGTVRDHRTNAGAHAAAAQIRDHLDIDRHTDVAQANVYNVAAYSTDGIADLLGILPIDPVR